MKVNPMPIKVPEKWLRDPELGPHVQELYFFLYQLFQRTGGGRDLIQDALNPADLNETFVSLNQDEIDLGFNEFFGSLDTPANADNFSNETFDKVPEEIVIPEERYSLNDFFNIPIFTTSVDFTTTESSIIIVDADKTITLNATPSDGERVFIKSDNTFYTIDGNGKTIDGDETARIDRKYADIPVVYSIDKDAWFVL